MATGDGDRREGAAVPGPVLQCFGLEMSSIVIRDGRRIDPGFWRKVQLARGGSAVAERQSLEIGNG